MALLNVRAQLPVGQGFFHAACILPDGGPNFHYVVDCGAMNSYATQRSDEVRAYLRHTSGAPLDFLYISHLHADHVNGVEQLLDPIKGISVDTIVLPLLSARERLFAYSRTLSKDESAAASPFYTDLIVEPLAALMRFRPKRVLFIERGKDLGDAPFSGDFPDDDRGPEGGQDFSATDGKWKLVGRGSVRRLPLPSGLESSGVVVAVAPDTVGIGLVAGSHHAWLLAPYLDTEYLKGQNKFVKVLSRLLGMTDSDFCAELTSPDFMLQLLLEGQSALKLAYGATNSDLNLSSLCIYSGPAGRIAQPKNVQVHRYGCDKYSIARRRYHVPNQDGRTAWLSTGDACLKETERRRALYAHFGLLLENVYSLTLPHHGSSHNFDGELLDVIQPKVCVTAADKYSNWNHPGSAVVQAVASRGLELAVVTSDSRAFYGETVEIY